MKEPRVWKKNIGFLESSWKTELAGLDEIHTSGKAPVGVHILLGTSQALRVALQVTPGSFTTAHSEFLNTIDQDLNGSWATRQSRLGHNGARYSAVWYSFKIKHVSNSAPSTRISYIWHQIMCFALHFPETKSAIIICLDLPSPTQKIIEAKLSSANWTSTSAFHPLLLSSVRDMYNDAVWSLRHFIRAAELQRTSTTHTSTIQPDFVHLHDLARHVIHSNEVLDVALTTVARLQSRCCDFHSADLDSETNLRDHFESIEHALHALKLRSSSLHARLQNEIQLAFNLVAHRDSRTTLSISTHSRQDSYSMRCIAIVGLIYLPATFVSGIFGTNFFSFGEQGEEWRVSEQFWLYWAVTVPLTLGTVAVWMGVFYGKGWWRGVRGWIGLDVGKGEMVEKEEEKGVCV